MLEGSTGLSEQMVLESVVDDVKLAPMDSVMNLQVIFEKSLNVVEHINLLVKNCNYYMRNVGAVRSTWIGVV